MNIERSRWFGVALCIALAGVMLLCGWLVPMHLRAVDTSVLQRAGEGHPSLIDRGLSLEHANNPEAARLVLEAAQAENIPWTGELASTLAGHADTAPIFPGGPALSASTNLTSQIMRLANRDKVFAFLDANGSPAVRELLRTRELTNTVIFTPSSAPSGQAFDAAVAITGLLLSDNQLSSGLREAIMERAGAARSSATAQPLEEILMDLMSLGQRFSWGQLAVFVNNIGEPKTLSMLTEDVRNAGPKLPELFSAVALSQQPAGVSAYLAQFSKTGMADLGGSLRYGEGGVNELLQRQQRLFLSATREKWTSSGPLAMFFRAGTDYSLHQMWFALAVKWFFYVSGGFLLAAALHWMRPAPVEMEESPRPLGYGLVREIFFAVGFLLVVLLVSEPYLAQDSQKAEFAFRLRLPLTGAVASSILPLVKSKLMNTRSLLTMLLFFVLQGLLYCASLAKLKEILRQRVPARMQLRLLDNEEHLFDGGLYLGFVGTIICLILVSLGIITQSVMAAYSSTSFGVIFVFIFKIFNLRPVRRKLLIAAESAPLVVETPVASKLTTA